MKKNIKQYILAMLCTVAVLCCSIVSVVAQDNEIEIISAQGSGGERREMNSYYSTNSWSSSLQSYIFSDNNDSFTVVDYSENSNTISADIYNMDFELINSISIPMELDLFGGFYAGEKYNYMVFGQNNNEEDNSKEVVRIVKYDKDFNRLAACAVKDCYTTIPFNHATLRMAEDGNELAVHTSRTRYTAPDGFRHQSQLTIILNTDTMSVKNNLGEFQTNHVSHSFNQFVKYYNNSCYFLDLGDAYPRAVVMNGAKSLNLFDIPGKVGANCTGITIGGFEISPNNFIAAINTIDHSKATDYNSYRISGLDKDERNIALLISSHDNSSTDNVKKVYLTDYVNKGLLGSTPYLVKLSDKNYMVLWQEFNYNSEASSENNGLKFVITDENGNPRYPVKADADAVLSSDCQPQKIGDSLIWYINESDGSRTFYVRDLNKDKLNQSIAVSEIPTKTYGDSSFKLKVTADKDSQLTDFTYTSDNPEVAEIAKDATVTIHSAGTARLTVNQAGNADYKAASETVTLTVEPKPIKIKSINLNNKTASFTGLVNPKDDVKADFSSVRINEIKAIDKTNSELSISVAELSGKDSKNYSITADNIRTKISNDKLVKVEVNAKNGSVSTDSCYVKGSTVNLSAKANSGYAFYAWYLGDKELSKRKSYSFIAENDVVLDAVFTDQPIFRLKDNEKDIKYMSLYADGSFRPDTDATRYEILSALDKLFDFENINDTYDFSDVTGEYRALVDKFAGTGVVNGYEDGSFRGDGNITRAELVKILSKMFEISEDAKISDRYVDINDHWARSYINTYANSGYVNGYPDGSFKPNNNVTRAEAVKLINNILGIKANDNSLENNGLIADISGHWAEYEILSVTETE